MKPHQNTPRAGIRAGWFPKHCACQVNHHHPGEPEQLFTALTDPRLPDKKKPGANAGTGFSYRPDF
ncbi:hypothetical protein APY04_1985 [Hyphomicrobium sulfonivorans]|uniref:Uncharacterized protein n=1 Tax=Hyphomicrobium sulfonivorans TaxID=121290 RepID=A0A125NUR1_HYPSL|nr:hypothetical protein APY04_1985 [Hyphomicrobium sulfonivorans]